MSNPVYMVGIIDVQDFQSYGERYGMPVGEMFAKIGAEIARELYNSEKYAPFKAARQNALAKQTTLAIVPALA